MTSKEALEELIDTYISWRAYQTRECIENDYRYQKVLKDLERLEKLEKAFDKACESLDWDCPEGQNLIDDFIDYFDCENCKNTEKECWKKYFLKEVIEDE